jgi:hypothetical protein
MRPLLPWLLFRCCLDMKVGACEERHSAVIRLPDGGIRLPDRRLIAAQLSLYHPTEILRDVETVGDLARLRYTLACRIGVEAGAIAADDLKFRIRHEPRRRG